MPDGPNGIDVTFELITPAYAGAAETSCTDGLRPPTLKALLRFWWRAMHPELKGRKLFCRESEIFGSTDPKVGQRLRVMPAAMWRPPDPQNRDFGRAGSGRSYLGYGIPAGQMIAPGERAEFALVLAAGVPRGAADELRGSLWLLSAFGGVGGRSRRGWGSVRVVTDFGSLPCPHSASTVQEVKDRLSQGLNRVFPGLRAGPTQNPPEHSAFSRVSRIAVGQPGDSWQQALDWLGEEFRSYRQILGARRGHAPGEVGPDFEKRAGWLGGVPRGDLAPFGSAFGLPHNAYFRGRGDTMRVGAYPRREREEARRASPLFLKVLRMGDHCVPVALWLPSQFLPDTYEVRVKPPGRREAAVSPPDDQAINWFFDGGNDKLVSYPGRRVWQGILRQGWTQVW